MALILPASTQHQLTDHWCWAAVASTVSFFYNHNANGHSQSDIVAGQLGQACSGFDATNIDNVPDTCNQPWDLGKALLWTQNLIPGGDLGRELTYQESVAQIQAGYIFCCEIVWTGTDFSHFVLVCGFDDSGNLIVGDPASNNPNSNNHSVPYNELLSNYSSGGSWRRTLGTQSAPQ